MHLLMHVYKKKAAKLDISISYVKVFCSFSFDSRNRKMKIVQPIVSMSHVESISIAHRPHSSRLSNAENEDIFGKGNNYWGHGHTWDVRVTIRGPVDATTGMVMNLSDLKLYMQKVLIDQLDHKHLDKDVPHFKKVVSTTENAAIFVFNELKKLLPNPVSLYKVKISSVTATGNNSFTYKG